jgi:hypothetical protein
MPRTCSVCVHPERALIDQALIAGQTNRFIAVQFSLSATAVQRHKDNHMPASMALASQAAEVARGDSLLDQVRCLQARALGILEKAEQANDLRMALMAIREARGTLELLARLQGELQDTTTVNVLVASPEWLTLRGRILQAIEPYPAARAALAEALQHAG